jgi:hypothetical protein
MNPIEEFIQRVLMAHNVHYRNNINGLIDKRPEASPNGNIIWHLYSDGKVTYQKGAWAYRQRSEFTECYSIDEISRLPLPFKFLLEADYKKTYVILTKEECMQFRKEMEELVRNSFTV